MMHFIYVKRARVFTAFISLYKNIMHFILLWKIETAYIHAITVRVTSRNVDGLHAAHLAEHVFCSTCSKTVFYDILQTSLLKSYLVM